MFLVSNWSDLVETFSLSFLHKGQTAAITPKSVQVHQVFLSSTPEVVDQLCLLLMSLVLSGFISLFESDRFFIPVSCFKVGKTSRLIQSEI